MRTPIYQIDAFTSRRFGGNPAAVIPLESFPHDALLQAIAGENNVPETAFLVPRADQWDLRWFSPMVEVALCGHGTLASAWVVTERLVPGSKTIIFHTRSGELAVRRWGDRFILDLPARHAQPIGLSATLEAAIGVRPLEVLHDGFKVIAVLESAEVVRSLIPHLAAIANLEGARGLIVTARGDEEYDFVSRNFTPQQGVPEDPVTGSAHCTLAQFWCERLGKAEVRAYQASARGGEMLCRPKADRVEIEGSCVLFMEGECEI